VAALAASTAVPPRCGWLLTLAACCAPLAASPAAPHSQVPARSTDSYHEENNGPPTDGLVFMGLISLVDPPREGVMEAVNKCVAAPDAGCRPAVRARRTQHAHTVAASA
jgi:hypothetical protein